MRAPLWGRRSRLRDLVAVLWSLAVYTLRVVPRVDEELRRWREVACTIPDATLRLHALSTLEDKALNAEAVAVFAILAPCAQRHDVIALMVAFQVLTDYLDTISEQPVADPLRSSLTLHRALVDALAATPGVADYYRHHPQSENVYAVRLVGFCRERFRPLPAAAAVRATAIGAAHRCGEGQSYTHEAIHRGSAGLAAWARGQPGTDGYRWWEVAAGASSSVAVHALLAAAADARTSTHDAESVDEAYFPSVGALTVLLDNLVDHDADSTAGTHNYLAYYATSDDAAVRLADIATSADAGARLLRRPHRNAAIVAGVTGFYLSAAEARSAYAAPVRGLILARVDGTVGPILTLMRVRRRLRRHRG
jgi:tetraprenyl-beta-curcumene synthase